MIINTGNLQTLYTSFHAAFMAGFGQAPADHEPFTMMVPSVTKENEYGWLGQFPGLREWLGERVIRGIKQHDYRIRNRKFESTVGVEADDIKDDHLGIYNPMFQEMGRAAAAHPCELVYELLKKGFSSLCYDGQYFFDTDHPDGKGGSASNSGGGVGDAWFLMDCSRALKPMIHQLREPYDMVMVDDPQNETVFMQDLFAYGTKGRCNVGFGLWQLAYGSRQSLTKENYASAREALMGYTGDQGRPLGIKPTHLVVPNTLEKEALTVLKAEYDAAGASNIYHNTATLIVTPWLS